MKYLVSDSLAAINNAICHREIGDRIYEGRIEAYSCKSNSSEREIHAKLLEALDNEYGSTAKPIIINKTEKEKKVHVLEKEKSSSDTAYSSFAFHQQSRRNRSRSNSLDIGRNTPLGDLSERTTRKMLIDLICTLNAIYPDYDFTSIRPQQFKRHTLADFRKDIASHLLPSSYFINDSTNNVNIGAFNLPRENSSPYRSYQHHDSKNRERKTTNIREDTDKGMSLHRNIKLDVTIPKNSSSLFHDHFRIQPTSKSQDLSNSGSPQAEKLQSPHSLSSDAISNFSSDAISNSPYSIDKKDTDKTETTNNEGEQTKEHTTIKRTSSGVSTDSWISNNSNSSEGPLQHSTSTSSTTITATDIDIIWNAITDTIDVNSALIFSYLPDLEGDPFSVGCLWSFNYFFVSREQKRILYFSVMARDKLQYTPRMQVGIDELGESEGMSSEIYDSLAYDSSNVIVYNNEYAEDEYETDVNEPLVESSFSVSRLTEPVSDSLDHSLSNPTSNSRRSSMHSLLQMDDELYLAAHSSYSEDGYRKRKRKRSKDFDAHGDEDTDDDTNNRYPQRQRSLSNASTATSVSSKGGLESKRRNTHTEQEKISSYPYAATVIYD